MNIQYQSMDKNSNNVSSFHTHNKERVAFNKINIINSLANERKRTASKGKHGRKQSHANQFTEVFVWGDDSIGQLGLKNSKNDPLSREDT